MDTSFQTFEVTSDHTYYNNKKFQIPKSCPHCKVVIFPIDVKQAGIEYNSKQDLNFLLHKCTSCSQQYITIHLRDKFDGTTSFLSTYPEAPSLEIPKVIEEFSSKFCNIYNQAAKAESLNHLELAATGYRMSLEVLVKDYAIHENPNEEEKIKSETLNNCLQKYYKELDTAVPAHVVKTLGNDYAHYVQKHPEVSFNELKYYLNIFIMNTEMKLKLKNPPVKVPDLSKQT